jgi:hypothetical protein
MCKNAGEASLAQEKAAALRPRFHRGLRTSKPPHSQKSEDAGIVPQGAGRCGRYKGKSKRAAGTPALLTAGGSETRPCGRWHTMAKGKGECECGQRFCFATVRAIVSSLCEVAGILC